MQWISQLMILLTLALVSGSSAFAQGPEKKNVVILNEVGPSHSLTKVMAQQITNGVQETPGLNVEFYSESLDILTYTASPPLPEVRDWLVKKYGGHNLAAVVAVGPDTIRFLADYSDSMFMGVPIVICGSAADQAGNPNLDSRFTGTWQQQEPGKTLEVALRLFPNTRHVFVVGGSSVYDRVVLAATKEILSSFRSRAKFTYLTDMEMEKLLDVIRDLPENSIVFYTSFFQDSAGHRYLNATKALPLVASAANAPVFGMSDTYLGHGIVGGDLMNFQKQGQVTTRIVTDLLQGKKAEDVPIETLPSMFMFDWNELKRWRIPESKLPSGSVIFFREPSLWERTKWLWVTSVLVILGLITLAGYLQYTGKQLKMARASQMQLSGMLINAGERERHRIASELHDDFSQRLAVLALGLENVDEATPASLPDVHTRLRELVNCTSELGTDLHTLSHRLHSSTLESLGLVPAVGALCKEFISQQDIRVRFASDEIPRSVHPDAALCVFRIVQEGLRNLKKHSGAEEAEVEMRLTGNRLYVTVRDEGCGFDLKGLSQNEGLGIRSMEERARSLGGKFEIHSDSGKGTVLRAWVPVQTERETMKI